MDKTEAKDIPVETAIFNDLWKYIKMTIRHDDSVEFWTEAADLADRLTAKYPGSDFCRAMLLAYMGWLEDESKKKREEGQ